MIGGGGRLDQDGLAAIPAAALTVARDGRIQAQNALAVALAGRDLVGTALSGLCDAGSAATVEDWVRRAGRRPVRLVCADGRRLGVLADTLPGVVILLDETQAAHREELSAEERRLATVGRLAAGVAHEINNPLAVVSLRLEMLDVVGADPSQRVALGVLREHAARIGRIVRDLQALARPGALQRDAVAFLDLVESARDQCRTTLGATPILLNVPADLRVWADAARIEQMLQHLLQHGAAAGKGAPVFVSALPWGGTARITFEDQGPRPLDDNFADLFTPFVAPRPGMQQSLGLAIARNIAVEHDGSIVAEPGSGGLRIVLQLPLASAAHVVPTPVPTTRAGRLLLVEDEEALVGLIAQTATEAGHTVVSVRSAEEAIERVRAEPFDALVTDNRLPGMGGLALLDAIADLPLADHAVLMSGQTPPTLRAGVRFLAKPFRRTELLRALADALATHEATAGTSQTTH